VEFRKRKKLILNQVLISSNIIKDDIKVDSGSLLDVNKQSLKRAHCSIVTVGVLWSLVIVRVHVAFFLAVT
jgi:hypothetical protein